MNPYDIEMMARLRFQELEREAALMRLRSHHPGRPLGLGKAISHLFGAMATGLGKWLHARPQTEQPGKECTCCGGKS